MGSEGERRLKTKDDLQTQKKVEGLREITKQKSKQKEDG